MPTKFGMTEGRTRLRALYPSEPAEAADLTGLVRRAAAKEPDAFEAIYRMFYDKVHTYAAVRLRSRDDAADATQECFLAVWRGLPRFEYRHQHAFEAWLFRIARNIVIDRIRRRGREIPTEELPLGEVVIEFENGVIGGREVIDLLDRVSVDQREVLILRFVLDLPLAQVAAITGKSEKAVSALQLRGLERLRKVAIR